MTEHCEYSPSSATRWMSCTASIVANRSIATQETTSIHAERGTAMHYVAGYMLLRHLEKFIDSYVQLRCLSHNIETPAFEVVHDYNVETFFDFKRKLSDEDVKICERMARTAQQRIGENLVYDNGRIITRLSVYLEQRVDALNGLVWGTPDIVVISGFKYAGDSTQITEQHIEVLDFKFGHQRVNARNNAQLMTYHLGAMNKWADECTNRKYKMTILQPSNVHSVVIDGIYLVKFGVSMCETIVDIENGEIKFVASDSNCQYCNVKNVCKARSGGLLGILKKVNK